MCRDQPHVFLICVRLSRLPRLPFGKKILNPIFLVSGLLLVNNGIDLILVLPGFTDRFLQITWLQLHEQAFGGLKLPLCHFEYIFTDVLDKQCNECGCCSKKIKTDDSRMVWYGPELFWYIWAPLFFIEREYNLLYESHYFTHQTSVCPNLLAKNKMPPKLG